ncbi:MAG: FHA domain-containing protein [Planctomycetota bacterium]
MSATASDNTNSKPVLPSDAPRFRLTAPGFEAAADYQADKPVILIGGRRDCDLALPHPDVSKVHCAIINTGRALLVRDLLSRSGTFVNDQFVKTLALKPGDKLRVGPVSINIELLDNTSTLDTSQAQHLRHPLKLQIGAEQIEISSAAAVIGRRSSADVSIDNPDVSLAHALLFCVDGQPAIFDLGSRSGTGLNGQRVELATLNDGDELDVGGERVMVQCCSAPTDAEHEPAPAEPEPSQLAEGDVPLTATPPTIPADLGDLESLIASVHTQISTARERINLSDHKLAERETEIARQSAALQARAAELHNIEAGLEQRVAEANATEQAARDKLAAADEREKALTQQHTLLAEERALVEQHRSETEQLHNEAEQLHKEATAQRQEIAEQQAFLQAEQARLAEAHTELEERQKAISAAAETHAALETKLHQREEELRQATAQLADQHTELEFLRTELDERDRQLTRREAEEVEAFRKIEQFKTALSQASTLLAETTPPTTQESEPLESPTDDSPSDISRTESPADDSDELPAPVVDKPLFSATPETPPSDWPPELRERFQVLRRMSNKSDADLLAQVWAEHDQLAVQAGEISAITHKKSRLPWRN